MQAEQGRCKRPSVFKFGKVRVGWEAKRRISRRGLKGELGKIARPMEVRLMLLYHLVGKRKPQDFLRKAWSCLHLIV